MSHVHRGSKCRTAQSDTFDEPMRIIMIRALLHCITSPLINRFFGIKMSGQTNFGRMVVCSPPRTVGVGSYRGGQQRVTTMNEPIVNICLQVSAIFLCVLVRQRPATFPTQTLCSSLCYVHETFTSEDPSTDSGAGPPNELCLVGSYHDTSAAYEVGSFAKRIHRATLRTKIWGREWTTNAPLNGPASACEWQGNGTIPNSMSLGGN